MKVNQFSYKAPDEETLRQMEEYYYDNHSIRDVAKKFNTSEMKIRVLRDKGLVRMERTPEQKRLFNSVKHEGIKHSEKTKKKLSLIRKKWISENPDKSPYILSHKSRGETYPEKYFREWLEKE
jgi:transposase